MDKLRKPRPPRKQLVFFARDQLIGDGAYAIIRTTWFDGLRVAHVNEAIVNYYQDNIPVVKTVVREAIAAGADVSIVSIDEASAFGIEPK